MRQYIAGFIQDHNGKGSSPRIIALLAFLAMLAVMGYGLTQDPSKHTFALKSADLLAWVVLGAIAAGQARAASKERAATQSTAPVVPGTPPASTPAHNHLPPPPPPADDKVTL